MRKDFCMCSKSEFHLCSVPPTQVEIKRGFWEDVDHVTRISSSDTIEFLRAANSGVYTDVDLSPWDMESEAFPNRIVIGLVDADAFNGTYTKNPFNLKNYDITTMGLAVNGERTYLENHY
ncbi:uncharacterized transposon-derived, partial [Paramuricea clavata]